MVKLQSYSVLASEKSLKLKDLFLYLTSWIELHCLSATLSNMPLSNQPLAIFLMQDCFPSECPLSLWRTRSLQPLHLTECLEEGLIGISGSSTLTEWHRSGIGLAGGWPIICVQAEQHVRFFLMMNDVHPLGMDILLTWSCLGACCTHFHPRKQLMLYRIGTQSFCSRLLLFQVVSGPSSDGAGWIRISNSATVFQR